MDGEHFPFRRRRGTFSFSSLRIKSKSGDSGFRRRGLFSFSSVRETSRKDVQEEEECVSPLTGASEATGGSSGPARLVQLRPTGRLNGSGKTPTTHLTDRWRGLLHNHIKLTIYNNSVDHVSN